MKILKFITSAILVVLPSLVSASEDGKDWLNAPDRGIYSQKGEAIPKSSIFEVVGSKLVVAVQRDLKNASFAELKEPAAQSLTGPYFQCPAGLRPFLLRAVYGHGGTGSFFVQRIERSILVAHGSLGRSTQYNKAAIVACLPHAPDVVYTTVSIAQ